MSAAKDTPDFRANIKPISLTATAIVIAALLQEACKFTFPVIGSAGSLGAQLLGSIVIAVLTHAFAALRVAYIGARGLPVRVAADIAKPCATLVGWQWKHVADTLCALAVSGTFAASKSWAQCAILLAVSLATTVAAVALTARTSRVDAFDMADVSARNVARHAAALITSGSALPVARVWYLLLAAFLDMASETVGYSIIIYELARGVAAWLLAWSVALVVATWRERDALAHDNDVGGDVPLNTVDYDADAAATRGRTRQFVDKTLVFVVAWGWWTLPSAALIDASGALSLALALSLAALYFALALAKAARGAPTPASLPSRRAGALLVALALASVDAQLGWAIKASLLDAVDMLLDDGTHKAAAVWALVVACSAVAEMTVLRGAGVARVGFARVSVASYGTLPTTQR